MMDDYLNPGMSEEQKEVFEAAHKEKLSRAALMKRLFSTEDGKQVLEYLRKTYVENCKWNPKLDVLDSIRWGFIREGQAMVVNNIESDIEFYDNELKSEQKEQTQNV